MNNTRIQKGRDGWEAKSTLALGKNRVLVISTHKTTGGLVTSATVHTEKDGYLSTILFQDFSKRTAHKGVRCTEKTVREFHQGAINVSGQTMAEAHAHYAEDDAPAEPPVLAPYTPAEVLAKQERDAAAPVAPKAYTKPVTADQVDLFNTQGGLFA